MIEFVRLRSDEEASNERKSRKKERAEAVEKKGIVPYDTMRAAHAVFGPKSALGALAAEKYRKDDTLKGDFDM